MTEYLPIIIVIGVALFALSVARQVQDAQKESEFPHEPLKFHMPIETIKVALGQIMTEPIQCRGVERYWLPPDITESPDGTVSLKYTIYYEYVGPADENGLRDMVLTTLTLTAELKAADPHTSLAEFTFEDRPIFGHRPEEEYLKSTTLSRVTQRLAQLSIQRQGY